MKALLVSAALAASALTSAVAQAQDIQRPSVSVVRTIPPQSMAALLAAIEAACLQGVEPCKAAIAAQIAAPETSSMTKAQLNSVLGRMAVVVVDVAQRMGAVGASYGEVLVQIAEASTNPNQRAVLLAVAQALKDGNVRAIGQAVRALVRQNASPA